MPFYFTFKVRWGGCCWPGDGWDDAEEDDKKEVVKDGEEVIQD